MGYREALEDNIRMFQNETSHSNLYYPKCHICSKEVKSLSYIRGNKYTCMECKTNIYLSDKDKKAVYDKYEKDKKFDNAINRVRAKTGESKFKTYVKAIELVKSNLYKDHWFDSTEEIMAAIELLHNKVKLRHQVKFGRYRVDFVLPDYKAILEVDGVLFHNASTRKKEEVRDNSIILSLGAEWEVIRISDKLINQNITRLLPAITNILKQRRDYRKTFKGSLPKWYNDRENIN
jgi:very-short-patch-repair endonuclease